MGIELESLKGELEEKKAKVDRLRAELTKAKYEEKLSQKTQAIKTLNDHKDALNAEFATLSSQASIGAKLDLKRQEVRTKNSEIKTLYASLASSRLVF